MIRYFAQTDATDTGQVAFRYLRALLRVSQVRLIAASPAMDGPWQATARLLASPMVGPFVNVVCCQPARWSWTQNVAMPNLDADGNVVSTDVAHGVVELYTARVRNVLLVNDPPPESPAALERALRTALRYQAFVVPTLALGSRWQRLDCHPRVIPVPVLDMATMRDVICPTS